MEINTYYQRQKCRPITLVSGNVWFMWIFGGVTLSGGVKRHWGLLTTAIFGDLGGYVFENFRDTASIAICYPLSTGNWSQNEWPWVAISWQIRFRPAILESERSNVRNSTTSAILWCSVHCTIS